MKAGMTRSTNPSICGLAFECNGEVCTTTRNDDLEDVKDISFHQVSAKDNTMLSISSAWGVNAYPVVRLSEILENGEAVIHNIHENTLELHRYNRKMFQETYQEMDKMIKSYPQMLSEYMQIQQINLENIEMVLQDLNKYTDDIEQDMDMFIEEEKEESQEALDYYNDLIVQLKAYNELYNRISMMTQRALSHDNVSKISAFFTHIKDAKDYNQRIKPSIGTIIAK
jgi:hypothetical protein